MWVVNIETTQWDTKRNRCAGWHEIAFDGSLPLQLSQPMLA
jgi:hypothetical protein